ncbi:MAG: DUF1320 domain-containing protein [Candidatus Kapabacteria bacterium]|nr:DUF1320 domain-containing protein [Candidatus Kapabacteria bacterium]
MYSTVNDIIEDLTQILLIEMTDDSDTPTTVNETLVESKIAEADALINSFVKGVSTLPITDSNDLIVLKKISVSLTVCDLWRRRSQTDYPEAVALRYSEAMNLLKQISNGSIKLNTEVPITSSAVVGFSASKFERKFSTNYFN